MKQTVLIDKRASKELSKFTRPVQLKFQALFEILKETGKLEEPFAKKLVSTPGLFEVRVKYQGQWRAIYAYLEEKTIIILSAFDKKTQKTPVAELDKAKSRMKEYE